MLQKLIEKSIEISKEVNAERIVLLSEEEIEIEIPEGVNIVVSPEHYVNVIKNTINFADSSGFVEKILTTPGISEFLSNYLNLTGEKGRSVVILNVGSLKGILILDSESRLNKVISECSERVSQDVLRAVIALSLSIAYKGREGRRIGTVFVIGDVEEVLKRSRQIVLNPFEGHPEEMRDIKNPENWETIREFAQLDGAFIVDSNGIIISAGRYLDVEGDIKIKSGLGGRHLASASITKNTKAIAVVISESGGDITIFKDGKVILEIPVSLM